MLVLGKRGLALRRRRFAAQPRAVDVDRWRIGASARREEENIKAFRRSGIDDGIDHLAREQRAVDEADEVLPPILERVVRRVVPVDRQREQKSGLGAAARDQRSYRRKAEAIVIA